MRSPGADHSRGDSTDKANAPSRGGRGAAVVRLCPNVYGGRQSARFGTVNGGMQGLDLAETARALAFVLIPMILSLSVHECAHAWSAYLLGDPTAKDAGRLTLNPQVHIDPWGTLFIPAMSVFIGGVPFLGWARPTPFQANRFREGINRRLGAAVVSLAGPLSNILLALASLSILVVLRKINFPLFSIVQDGESFVARRGSIDVLLLRMYELNLGLAFFNLLPIPPLDGYRLLPRVLDPLVRPLERYGFALLMLVFLFLPPSVLGAIFGPVLFVMDRVRALFGVA
jgi:Zn-dependent protease